MGKEFDARAVARDLVMHAPESLAKDCERVETALREAYAAGLSKAAEEVRRSGLNGSALMANGLRNLAIEARKEGRR